MKNYASLKELTFFSFSVYLGLAVIAFALLHDLLDDFVGMDLIFIGWIVAIPGLLILFLAALIYSGTQLMVMGWKSFLPLEANLLIGGCVFIILSNGLSSKLELNLKWSGYTEIVRQVEQGRFKGNGRHALPA